MALRQRVYGKTERGRAVSSLSTRKSKYGLTVEQLAALGSSCSICERPLRLIGERNAKDLLHVDHSHRTGRVRGVLCGRCNIGIGYFDDNAARLDRASAYLRGESE